MIARKILNWRSILWIVAAWLLIYTVEVGNETIIDADGYIWIELEDCPKLDSACVAVKSSDTSGGGFVKIEGLRAKHPDYGQIVSGESAHRFESKQPGSYFTWIRVRWSGECSNSITVALQREEVRSDLQDHEGPTRFLVGNNTRFNEWHWIRGPVFALEAGAHGLLLGTRESDAEIDCIALTREADFRPDGIQSFEEWRSKHPGAGVAANGSEEEELPNRKRVFVERFASVGESSIDLNANWKLDGDDWKKGTAIGSHYGVGPTEARSAMAEARLQAFSSGYISCALRLLPRAGAGIFFGRSAAGRQFLVRMASDEANRAYAGRIELCEEVDGKIQVLQRANRDLTAFRSQHLELLKIDDFCQVFLNGVFLFEANLSSGRSGTAGLWVDGQDALLASNETLGMAQHMESGVDRFRMSPVLSHLDNKPTWQGVVFNRSGEGATILRWSDFDQSGGIAKRIQIVKHHRDGGSEPLSEKSGQFSPEDCGKLAFFHQDGRLMVMLGNRPLMVAPMSSPIRSIANLSYDQPRVVFGEFSIVTLLMTTREELDLQPDSLASSNELPRTIQVGDEGKWGSQELTSQEFSAGTVSLRLHGANSRFGLSISGDESAHLWFSKTGSEMSVELVLPSGEDSSRFTSEIKKLVEADQIVQLVLHWNEIYVVVNDELVLSAPRSSGRIESLTLLQPLGTTAISNCLVTPHSWESRLVGPSWPPRSFSGRYGHGDISVILQGERQEIMRNSRLQLQASSKQAGSGYELLFDDPETGIWTLFKEGRRLSSGTLRGQNGEITKLRLSQEGSTIQILQDGHPLDVLFDPEPFREGFMHTWKDAAPESVEILGRILQPWDVRCAFMPGRNQLRDDAVWRRVQGDWRLIENSGRLNGCLAGSRHDAGEAVLESRSELDLRDVLVEVAVIPNSLISGCRFELAFEPGAGSAPGDSVRFSIPSEGSITTEVIRGAVRSSTTQELEFPDPDRAFFSIVRNDHGLRAYVNYRLATEVSNRSLQNSGVLRIRVGGRSNVPVGFDSIAYRTRAHDPEKLSRQLKTYLGAYRAFLSR